MASRTWRARPLQLLQWTAWLVLVVEPLVPAAQGVSLEPPPPSLRSLTDEPAQLPCVIRGDTDSVVQVSWSREQPDGTKEMVITAHRTEGQKEFAPYTGRVRFVSSDPMSDASLVIQITRESDEAHYTCHVTTFPSGNFESQMFLSVWSVPISSLDPVVLVEGQPLQVAATCRSVAWPLPALSWDTKLEGYSQNRTLSRSTVSTSFSVEPLRSMNGARLDCIVWHPALRQPRRIANRLVVHYPPEAVISGFEQSWYVGREEASLSCTGSGNPKPQNITWSRKDGTLPVGTSVQGEVLLFTRPLNKTDEGVYECVVNNGVGIGKISISVMVTERNGGVSIFQSPVIVTAVCGAAGALVAIALFSLVVVKCRYKHKTSKLKKELNERKEELVSLSRQNSVRRLNSFSSDPRIQMDENMPLRPGSALSSLRELPGRTYSTCSGSRRSRGGDALEGTAGCGLRDSVLHEDQGGERDTEVDGGVIQLRGESFMKNSNMSLAMSSVSAVGGLQRLGSRDCLSPVRSSINGAAGLQHLGSRERLALQRTSVTGVATVARCPGPSSGAQTGERWECTEEDEEDDSRTNSSQISEALSNYFHYSNGFLQPKRQPNSILIDHSGQII